MSIIEKAVSKLQGQSQSSELKEGLSSALATADTVQKAVAAETVPDEHRPMAEAIEGLSGAGDHPFGRGHIDEVCHATCGLQHLWMDRRRNADRLLRGNQSPAVPPCPQCDTGRNASVAIARRIALPT